MVWNLVNLKGIDPTVALIRLKLELALQHDPANHRLLEDAAKLLTKHSSAGSHIDEFDRRQFRTTLLNTLEVSHSYSARLRWQNRTNRAYFNN